MIRTFYFPDLFSRMWKPSDIIRDVNNYTVMLTLPSSRIKQVLTSVGKLNIEIVNIVCKQNEMLSLVHYKNTTKLIY